MSVNQENIEARLCAYVDGELPPADRAQLEKTLAVHPEYRKLLAEVGEMRDLLRALPRTAAPPGVTEALQGQLERGALLDLEAADANIVRFNYWPHLMAVAAILLLAVGLGAVVYFVLPHGQPQVAVAPGSDPAKHREAELKNAEEGVQSDPDAMSEKRSAAKPDREGEFASKLGDPTTGDPKTGPRDAAVFHGKIAIVSPPAPDAAKPQTFVPSPSLSESMKGRDSTRSLAGAEDVRRAQEQLRGADLPVTPNLVTQAAENATLVVLVHANDVNQANGIVTKYLSDNRIACQAIPDDTVRRDLIRDNGYVIGTAGVSNLALNNSGVNYNGGTLSLDPNNVAAVGNNTGTGLAQAVSPSNITIGKDPGVNPLNLSQPQTPVAGNVMVKGGALSDGDRSNQGGGYNTYANNASRAPAQQQEAPGAGRSYTQNTLSGNSTNGDQRAPIAQNMGIAGNKNYQGIVLNGAATQDSTGVGQLNLNLKDAQNLTINNGGGGGGAGGGNGNFAMQQPIAPVNAPVSATAGRRAILARMNVRQAEALSKQLTTGQGERAEVIRDNAVRAEANALANVDNASQDSQTRRKAEDEADKYKRAAGFDQVAVAPTSPEAAAKSNDPSGGVIAPRLEEKQFRARAVGEVAKATSAAMPATQPAASSSKPDVEAAPLRAAEDPVIDVLIVINPTDAAAAPAGSPAGSRR